MNNESTYNSQPQPLHYKYLLAVFKANIDEFLYKYWLGKTKLLDFFLFNFWTVLKALNKSSISISLIYFCPIFNPVFFVLFEMALFISEGELLVFDSFNFLSELKANFLVFLLSIFLLPSVVCLDFLFCLSPTNI